ncbi:hypothetical protein [Proteiniphilum sp. X52]|uniref:hypothetical protein n=1 Tax=Proteiniphilum sp. X52 TaxID=2382159 RepID=UPI000F0A59E2|nr:hypothetical protein D7D25_07230 [Proteiniphilum sp. X52]
MILFVNGSPNRDGNTAALARKLLKGKQLYFIFQGAGPSQAMLDAGDHTMRTFCRLAGLEYMGMTTY